VALPITGTAALQTQPIHIAGRAFRGGHALARLAGLARPAGLRLAEAAAAIRSAAWQV